MESRFVSSSECFYHDINNHNNFVLYRIKYSTSGHREFLDLDRDMCSWCYNFLGKKIKLVHELSDLKNIKKRHPNLRYIAPMKASHEMIVIWGMPSREEWNEEIDKTLIRS